MGGTKRKRAEVSDSTSLPGAFNPIRASFSLACFFPLDCFLQVLLRHGAMVNKCTHDKRTPMYGAADMYVLK